MNQTEATTAGWPSDEGERDLTPRQRLLMELLAILSRYAHEDGAGGMYGEGAVETLERITNELDKRRCQAASEGDQTGQCAVHFRDDECKITMHCVRSAGHPGEHHYHQMPGNNCVCRPVELDAARIVGVVAKPSPPPNHDLRTGDLPKAQVDPVGWARWWERESV